MKKIWITLLLALVLTGCKVSQDIKLDTIVDIPLHPTQAPTQAAAETQPTAPPETEAAIAATEPTEIVTEATENQHGSGNKTPDLQKPGKKNTGSSQTSATEPPTMPPTQPVTELPTELPTEPPSEAPTEVPTDPPAYDPAGYIPGSLDRGVADAVNAQRQAVGLEALTLDTRLCAIASVRAWEASQVWSQSRPDGTVGVTVLSQYGYSYGTAGENLYFGGAGADAIVSKWMSSVARKNNILMASATAIGVGSYTSADGLTYVAALFVG